jgi:regulator of RNase E activity RraB
METNLDRHILRLLKKQGSNFKKPHAVEFYVYFKNKTSAQKARARLKRVGFHVELLNDSSGKRWICLSILEVLPRYKAIQAVKRKLNALAKPMGGHCDAWGTQMEK